ncbi:MAG TPA: FAD-dependent oxidoreductase [Mycobacteriales bacterium]|nr:FAD-dependent oxidoreductase [Mycobacteriales bacterium]
MPGLRRVVVVGGGLAGARAVRELRAQGFGGEVVLVGAEARRPYDRPPLSKDVLLGRSDDAALDVDWPALDVDLRLGVRATGLEAGVLRTSDGDVGWDGLVLAVGADARRLGGARVLRTLDDALALRAALVPGARVVVVGAGWVGAEVATAAAAAGCRTTVVEAGPSPLPALGGQGRWTAPWYAAAGVDLRLEAPVARAASDEVVLQDGTVLDADVVVAGVGARPATGWLAGTGLLEDGAVACDEHLAARWPGVVAAGDCASWTSRRYGGRLRVEHWDDALQAPAVAVTTLLGGDAVHDPVPYFWSDQLGHVVQLAGVPRGEAVHRGDPQGGAGWSVCWLQDSRLQAVLAVDRPRDLVQGRRLVAEGRVVDPARLADADVPLKALGG